MKYNLNVAAPSSSPISYGSSAVSFGPETFGPAMYNGLAGPEIETEGGMPGDLAQIFAESTRKMKTYQLPGDLGRFLGKIEQYEYALVLRGNKGAGKSRLLYQLMNVFSSQGWTGANFSLEMAKDSSVSKGYLEQYVAPENRGRIKHASEAPEGINTIRKAAEFFDFIVIDSFGKLGTKQEEFDRLRKDFPNVFWLVIFQSTTAGTARGGAAAEYDGGAVLQVNDGGVAVFEKNRYATQESMDLAYLVFEQKAVPLDSVA